MVSPARRWLSTHFDLDLPLLAPVVGKALQYESTTKRKADRIELKGSHRVLAVIVFPWVLSTFLAAAAVAAELLMSTSHPSEPPVVDS